VLYHNSHFVDTRKCNQKAFLWHYVYNRDMLTTEEVDMMSPLNLDCTFLENYAQSFGWIEGNLSGISFRKTNTKIDVGESKSYVLFSPLNLVKWRWFSMETIPASSSSRNRQWHKKLCLSIPWIKDNPKDTLEASPFAPYTVKLKISSQTLKGGRGLFRYHISANC
jgi:hypothetical protein